MPIVRMFSVITMLLTGVASAQWLGYPTPGIPRTPDGKPNLSAPAPKTADGKPDLSGVWVNFRIPRAPQAQAAGARPAGAADPTPPGFPTAPSGVANDPAPTAPPGLATAGPPLATFFNIGQNLPGGAPLKPAALDVSMNTSSLG